jgi:hypothetical protein
MASLTANVDLSTMTQCCVLAAHRLPGIARPGDTATCAEGHHLVCDAGRVWTRAKPG